MGWSSWNAEGVNVTEQEMRHAGMPLETKKAASESECSIQFSTVGAVNFNLLSVNSSQLLIVRFKMLPSVMHLKLHLILASRSHIFLENVGSKLTSSQGHRLLDNLLRYLSAFG